VAAGPSVPPEPPVPLRIRGTDAGTGEPVDLSVADGRFVEAPAADSVALAGFVLPGLVDAHCHVGYSPDGATTLDEAVEQLRLNQAAGALLLRDCGSPLDTRSLVDRDDLPVLLRAGRHLARPKRYIRELGLEVEPEQLPAAVAEQLAYGGGGWIKLVGDWIDRSTGDLAPLWPDDVLTEAIAVAHAGGARVTAHVFSEDAVPGLLTAGIDCLEHGTGLLPDTIDEVVRRGVHLVPTLTNIDNFPTFIAAAGRFPVYARHMTALYERNRATVRAAIEAGVAVHPGTDAGGNVPHGLVVREVLSLAELVPDRRRRLRMVARDTREWLGLPSLQVDSSADVVVYPSDPAADLGVLAHPTAVVRAGRIVAGSLAA
jgi:imidazolonepropionase-like amidohydrolase